MGHSPKKLEMSATFRTWAECRAKCRGGSIHVNSSGCDDDDDYCVHDRGSDIGDVAQMGEEYDRGTCAEQIL